MCFLGFCMVVMAARNVVHGLFSGIKCDYYNHYNLVDVVFLRFIMTTITTLRKQLYVGVSWIDPYELGWFCKAILNWGGLCMWIGIFSMGDPFQLRLCVWWDCCQKSQLPQGPSLRLADSSEMSSKKDSRRSILASLCLLTLLFKVAMENSHLYR